MNGTVRRDILLPVVLVFAFCAIVPLPTILAYGIAGVQPADILALMVIALAVTRARRCDSTTALLGCVFLIMAIFYAVYGLAQGATVSAVARDFRPFLRVAAVMFGASAVVFSTSFGVILNALFKLVVAVVAYTLCVIIISQLGMSELFAIRVGTASLYADGASFVTETVRISPSSALFCTVGTFACWWVLTQKTDIGVGRPILSLTVLGGLVVACLAYSRSYLVFLLVSILTVWLIGPHRLRVVGGVCKLLALFGTILVAVLFVDGLFSWGLTDYLRQSGEAYIGRVITGLQFDTLATDTSATWRAREAGAAEIAFQSSPLLGAGFGVPYRDYFYPEIFSGNEGLTYLHSAYLWVLVKMGLVGSVCLTVLLCAFVISVARLRRRHGATVMSPLLGIVAGLLVVMIASPTPFEPANSVLIAIVLAMGFVGARYSAAPSEGSGELRAPGMGEKSRRRLMVQRY